MNRSACSFYGLSSTVLLSLCSMHAVVYLPIHKRETSTGPNCVWMIMMMSHVWSRVCWHCVRAKTVGVLLELLFVNLFLWWVVQDEIGFSWHSLNIWTTSLSSLHVLCCYLEGKTNTCLTDTLIGVCHFWLTKYSCSVQLAIMSRSNFHSLLTLIELLRLCRERVDHWTML